MLKFSCREGVMLRKAGQSRITWIRNLGAKGNTDERPSESTTGFRNWSKLI